MFLEESLAWRSEDLPRRGYLQGSSESAEGLRENSNKIMRRLSIMAALWAAPALAWALSSELSGVRPGLPFPAVRERWGYTKCQHLPRWHHNKVVRFKRKPSLLCSRSLGRQENVIINTDIPPPPPTSQDALFIVVKLLIVSLDL